MQWRQTEKGEIPEGKSASWGHLRFGNCIQIERGLLARSQCNGVNIRGKRCKDGRVLVVDRMHLLKSDGSITTRRQVREVIDPLFVTVRGKNGCRGWSRGNQIDPA